MNENDLQKIEQMLQHHIGIMSESIHHKLDIVVEGQHMLLEKMDRMEARLDARFDCVINKLDKVAAQGDAAAAKLDEVAAQGDATAAKLDDLVKSRHPGESRGPVLS